VLQLAHVRWTRALDSVDRDAVGRDCSVRGALQGAVTVLRRRMVRRIMNQAVCTIIENNGACRLLDFPRCPGTWKMNGTWPMTRCTAETRQTVSRQLDEVSVHSIMCSFSVAPTIGDNTRYMGVLGKWPVTLDAAILTRSLDWETTESSLPPSPASLSLSSSRRSMIIIIISWNCPEVERSGTYSRVKRSRIGACLRIKCVVSFDGPLSRSRSRGRRWIFTEKCPNDLLALVALVCRMRLAIWV